MEFFPNKICVMRRSENGKNKKPFLDHFFMECSTFKKECSTLNFFVFLNGLFLAT